jgi:hypothetical protein
MNSRSALDSPSKNALKKRQNKLADAAKEEGRSCERLCKHSRGNGEWHFQPY